MEGLRQRVMEALQRSRQPMSTSQIAWRIKESAERISGPVARLAAYGFIVRVGHRHNGRKSERVYRINVKEGAYR